MSAFVRDRMGASLGMADDALIDRVLADLDDPRDDEHPDVAIEHETGWCLAAFQSGLLVWENVEEDSESRHMANVPRRRVREMFLRVAAGDLGSVHAEPWLPGYG